MKSSGPRVPRDGQQEERIRTRTSSFGARIVRWQRESGRHDLPWQDSADPYRIWVSEIMLQQTQVGTVIPRFEEFMRRFPDVKSLARADIDEVMRCWSGLGYYARARNLHRAAQGLARDAHGVIPDTVAKLQALPGIGRSTAAAIAVFAFGARAAILDANVKRVLARHFGLSPMPGGAVQLKRLWQLAEQHLPRAHVGTYSQGLMDLGATVCKPRVPLCGQCPLAGTCANLADGNATSAIRPARPAKPRRHIVMLVIQHRGAVLLEQRPPHGIWGALWSFPEMPGKANAANDCAAALGVRDVSISSLPEVEHGLTHMTMILHPFLVNLRRRTSLAAGGQRTWVSLAQVGDWALPAPTRKILEQTFGTNVIQQSTRAEGFA